jgi:hypothetical protein
VPEAPGLVEEHLSTTVEPPFVDLDHESVDKRDEFEEVLLDPGLQVSPFKTLTCR